MTNLANSVSPFWNFARIVEKFSAPFTRSEKRKKSPQVRVRTGGAAFPIMDKAPIRAQKGSKVNRQTAS
jgi:hypothetical protein